jgi:glycosyltransferase involved in cell wall biosynthesis
MNNKQEIILSVVLPCRNEERSIAFCINEIKQTIGNSYPFEIVVSNNLSTDKSKEIALSLGARVVDCPNIGYGSTVRFGIENAKGKYVIFADADKSYDFTKIPLFMERAKLFRHPFIIGNRMKGKIEKGAMPFANRYFGTPAISLFASILTGMPYVDINCGMRCALREDFLKLKLTSTGMEYASEMAIKAYRADLEFSEIPIGLRNDEKDRKPHLRPIRDGVRHLRCILSLV